MDKANEVSNFEIEDLGYSKAPQEQMGTLAEFVVVNSVQYQQNQKILLSLL